jgi:hypothetical protein
MSDSHKAKMGATYAADSSNSLTNSNPSIVVAKFPSVPPPYPTTLKQEEEEEEEESMGTNVAPSDTAALNRAPAYEDATKQISVASGGHPTDASVGAEFKGSVSEHQPPPPSSYHHSYPNAHHLQSSYPTPPHGHLNMAYQQPPTLNSAPSMTYHQMPPLAHSGAGSMGVGMSPNGRMAPSPSSGEYAHRLPPPPLPINGAPTAAAAAAASAGAHYHHPHPATAHLHPHAIPPQAAWQAYPIATDISVPTSSKTKSKPKQLTTPPDKFLNLTEEQVSKLISDSTLVTMQERKFVPDYLFISIAQLEISHLTNEDQIGVYRDRKLGQIGLCCRHCKGSPGNGRYFPETVRSLGQSTTSATIAKHMSEKCPMMPIEIRNVIKQLKYEQDWMDQLVKKKVTDRYESRPKYGSRKLFFNTVWKRLTGHEEDDAK